MQARIELPEKEVHVWAVWLTGSGTDYRALLSTEESDRASRFVFDRHREAYVISQGALRVLLGRYLGRQPEDLVFTLGPHGKPGLSGIGFNKSDSSRLALYAFTTVGEVGVDVEEVRAIPDSQKIAARYFSKEDAAKVAKSESPEMFFRCWTRAEACVKASGEGLSALRKRGDWTVHDLDPAPGYVGAVAYRGERKAMLFQGFLTL